MHTSMLGASITKFDNRNICSDVEDQGNIGSCTANALAALVESNELKRGALGRAHLVVGVDLPLVTVTNVAVDALGVVSYVTRVAPADQPAPTPPPDPTPAPPEPPKPVPPKLVQSSRLFTYYATRLIEHTTREDSGATIRDTVKSGNKYGVVDEALWAYDITQFATRPPDAVWTQAAAHKITSYHSISDGDVETMKSMLALQNLVIFGFEVYSAMLGQDVAKTGMLCRPKSSEYYEGGHATALVGFDDNLVMPDKSVGAFLVRNSWGTNWGLGGYFWMPYNYVGDTRLASDFWVVLSSPLSPA